MHKIAISRRKELKEILKIHVMNLKEMIIHSWQEKSTSMTAMSKEIINLDATKYMTLYKYSFDT